MDQLEEILKEIGSKPDLNEDNVIEEVKKAFQEKNSDLYESWREAEFDIDYKFLGKWSLLHVASRCNFLGMAKALLNNGANVDGVSG